MNEPYRKGDSESILASSLAGDTARYHLKRRQRYWWAGLLSFEKPMEQDADSIPSGGRQHDNHINREWIVRSCVVLEPAHAENNMHENRDISRTPWSAEQGRSAKAINQTADTN